MLNLIFADIHSIIIKLVKINTLKIIGDGVVITRPITAITPNIPILMIYFFHILPYKLNRISNISAELITVIYVIGGGSLTPH